MLLSGLWKHRQSWAIGGYCSDMGHNPWHPLYMWKSTVGSWPPKEKFKLFPSLMFAWICIPDRRESTKSAPCSPSVHEIDQPPHMSAAASIKLILSWAFRCGKIQRVARELQTIFSMLQWSFNLSKVKDGMHSACAIKLSVDRCLSDLGDAHSWNIYYVFWMVVNIIWYKLTQWKFYPSITSTPYAIYYIPPYENFDIAFTTEAMPFRLSAKQRRGLYAARLEVNKKCLPRPDCERDRAEWMALDYCMIGIGTHWQQFRYFWSWSILEPTLFILFLGLAQWSTAQLF